LPGLKQKAGAGDAIAAYRIATMLEDCKRMFRGYDDARTNKERLDKCDGIAQDDLNASVQWLQIAADAGSAEAMQAYGLYGSLDLTVTDAIRDPQAIQDYKDRSKRYLETLAAAGSPSAMTSLASDYYNGIMLPQNFQLACAYEFAADLLMGREDSMFCSPPLTAEQIEAAREMGRRMAAACCPNGPSHEYWHPEGGSE
jgi:TPR repeat protein